MAKIRKILFVCTGNSCRSVMAEFLLKKMIKKSSHLNLKEFKISSAGTHPVEGMPPPEETIKVLSKENIDVSKYKAKRVTFDMVKEAQLILVMQEYHKESVQAMSENKQKVYILRDFCLNNHNNKKENLEIIDPIGKPLEVYENCLQIIKDCLERLMEKIKE